MELYVLEYGAGCWDIFGIGCEKECGCNGGWALFINANNWLWFMLRLPEL